jgi:hypothetical protein
LQPSVRIDTGNSFLELTWPPVKSDRMNSDWLR